MLRSICICICIYKGRGHRLTAHPTHTNTPHTPHHGSRKEGAYGLVVNQLSDMTLPQAVEGGLAPEFFQAFGKNALRRGGPVRLPYDLTIYMYIHVYRS